MRRPIRTIIAFVIIALVAVGCASTPPSRHSGAARGSLRVLTYNIHHGRGADGHIDLPRLAEVIRRTRPDLVSLQEVDVRTNRAHGVDQAATLAELTGMNSVYGKAMDYDGGQYGVAILSRFDIIESYNHALPYTEGYEPRTALMARVNAPGIGPVEFIATHWQHNLEEDRVAQAKVMDMFAVEFHVLEPRAIEFRPSILAGDLNSRPDEPPMAVLLPHWLDTAAVIENPQPTYPADTPDRRIDYVMLGRGNTQWRVLSTTVIDERVASDHRPLLVELQWTPDP